MARGIRVVGAGVSSEEGETETPVTPQAPAATSAEKAVPESAETPEIARRSTKVWSGRLGSRTARRVEEYTSSFAYDRRLYADDIEGSLAHARMLRKVGLISVADHRAIADGLREIRREFEKDEFAADPGDEDIHTAIERRLQELIGPPAGKLHTARSRNDQVATDLRLYCKRQIRELMLACAGLQESLLRRAQEHRTALMPGYTHTQRAQIVSLAHHLLAYIEMLQRDIERLEAAHDRCDVLPLGSGALAATTLPIERRSLAADLNFDALSANSLDAVSDRDFVVELISACALLMTHLSRLAEEIVLWTTSEFGFAELPDAYATGSSLMPQKKNPDVLELARGRVGRVIGDLVAILTVLKGTPLSYNRDFQEDKEPLFDAADTALQTLRVLSDVVRHIRFDVAAMHQAASDPMLLATDVAEYLVVRGMAFREAHAKVGAIVRLCVKSGRTLTDLSLDEWRAVSPLFDADVVGLFEIEGALRRREVVGGPGPKAVSRALVRAATLVAKTRRVVPVLARQPSAVKEVGAGVRRGR